MYGNFQSSKHCNHTLIFQEELNQQFSSPTATSSQGSQRTQMLDLTMCVCSFSVGLSLNARKRKCYKKLEIEKLDHDKKVLLYIDHPLINFVFNIWCQKGRLYNESLGHATLCGTATMVEVVWVGSLIEKDWNNSKDYWSHIRQTDSTDHSAKRTSNKSEQGKSKVQGPDMASV